jgi:hypothetical protein
MAGENQVQLRWIMLLVFMAVRCPNYRDVMTPEKHQAMETKSIPEFSSVMNLRTASSCSFGIVSLVVLVVITTYSPLTKGG